MSNEELVALIKKNPVGFGCGVLSLVFAVGLYFRSGEIPAAEAALAQKSAQAHRLELNIKHAAQLKEQLDEAVAANKAIDARMLRVSDLGNNSQFFFRLFAETGVKQVDFRQMTTAANVPKGGKSAFIPVAFSVAVQGSMPRILDFIRLIESGTHYSRVLTAQCNGTPTARGDPLTLTLNLELLGIP